MFIWYEVERFRVCVGKLGGGGCRHASSNVQMCSVTDVNLNWLLFISRFVKLDGNRKKRSGWTRVRNKPKLPSRLEEQSTFLKRTSF